MWQWTTAWVTLTCGPSPSRLGKSSSPTMSRYLKFTGPRTGTAYAPVIRLREVTDGPPDPEWLVPDWGAAAEDWDGVHLSLGGLLTAEQVRYQSEDGISMLNFWQAEQTYWLRGFVSNARRLPDHEGRPRPDHIEIACPNPGSAQGCSSKGD